jgi:hypothetical protein
MTGDQGDSDTSRAELFDSLGHPLRIRISQVLEAGSLDFGDSERKVGFESNRNLQYHLSFLDGQTLDVHWDEPRAFGGRSRT